MLSKLNAILVLIFAASLYYLPIFINPKLLLERGNDLQEFFWPVYYYIKKQILESYSLPLWNSLFLSGTPLLPDPQFSLFYPFNLLFILLPINSAFLLYFVLHSILGSLGIYLLSTKAFNLSKISGVFAAVLYLSTPRISGAIEAGHLGVFATFAWLPFVLLSVVGLTKKIDIKWAILLGISLAGIFYTHTVIFILTIPSTVIFYLALINANNFKILSKKSLFLIIGLLLTLGLVAVALIPQISWLPETTRFLLLENRDVYPKWTSITQVFQIVLAPVTLGLENIQKLDTEQWIAIGTTTFILALFGFWKLKTNLKIYISATLLTCLLVALNNASPIYKNLLLIDWYALMRVSTRIWFVPILMFTLLASFGFEQLAKNLNKKVILIVALLVITEQVSLSYIYLLKPTYQNPNLAPDKIYKFFKSDSGIYRVYCVNRCLSQQKASFYNLELVDGYNTLQQKNFYQQAWQLTGGFWNYYTLSIPPIGTYTLEKLQPDPKSLGEYNTKYVLSPYPLTNKDFTLITQIDNFLIYKNNLYKERAYFENSLQEKEPKITKYTSNQISVDLSGHLSKTLTLSQVYSLGWKAYLDGTKHVAVQQKPNALMLVDLGIKTKFVNFKYEPDEFKLGALITSFTLLAILLAMVKNFRVKL